jgi:hypothetical protein
MKIFEYNYTYITGGLKKEYQYDGIKDIRPGYVPIEAADYKLVVEKGNLFFSLISRLWERSLCTLNHPCCGGFPWNFILPERILNWFANSLFYFDGKQKVLTSIPITHKQVRILSPALIETDESIWWDKTIEE